MSRSLPSFCLAITAAQSALTSSAGSSARRSSVCFWLSGTTFSKYAAATSGSEKSAGAVTACADFSPSRQIASAFAASSPRASVSSPLLDPPQAAKPRLSATAIDTLIVLCCIPGPP